jgi:collagenase-like PrtC family protease
MAKNEIVTFAASERTCEIALREGADRLVLEDSRFCVRSFSDETENVPRLARFARKIRPDVKLSANCDLLAHHGDLAAIEKWAGTVKKAGVDTFRIQDPGLISLLDAEIELATETGNQNIESLSYFSGKAKRQILSNEMPKSEIAKAIEKVRCEFEIQVQGPILLQYSLRRFLGRNTTVLAQDAEYAGRNYVFHDNAHGHFMFLYFDRCLLNSMAELEALGLAGWLIDARGESEEYLATAIRAYQGKASLADLEKTAQRSQKPGFFKMNKTDQDLGRKTSERKKIGVVLDCVAGKSMTLELSMPLAENQALEIETPEGKRLAASAEGMRSVWGESISQARPAQLVCLKWHKGVTPKSVVYLAGDPSRS